MHGQALTGPYKLRDWAPIYLSEPLIDSEFGALLNVTDQMLKSWTEAGQIEYAYFNYPKPDHFPFGREPLTRILARKLHTHSLLFNWNTAGSAVVVHRTGFSTITVKQTGALPITYGADSKTKAEGGADVFSYEDQAYQYFASLADPCLHRVVQYTLIYQLFRAIATDPENLLPSKKEEISESLQHSARSAGQAVLRQQAERFIEDLLAYQSAGSTTGDELWLAKQKLSQVFAAFPTSLDKSTLATILVSRDAPESKNFYNQLGDAVQADVRGNMIN